MKEIVYVPHRTKAGIVRMNVTLRLVRVTTVAVEKK